MSSPLLERVNEVKKKKKKRKKIRTYLFDKSYNNVFWKKLFVTYIMNFGVKENRVFLRF